MFKLVTCEILKHNMYLFKKDLYLILEISSNATVTTTTIVIIMVYNSI